MATPQESNTPTVMLSAEEKEQQLRRLMREMQTVLVAYSGGVDSSYLALIATQELGEKAFCVMGLSPSVANSQRIEAEKIARDFKFNYLFNNIAAKIKIVSKTGNFTIFMPVNL